MKLEKMSKSRGNVVSVDEVVKRVYKVQKDYVFCNPYGDSIDCEEVTIYWNNDGYQTSKQFGNQPVFLCLKDESVPPLIRDKVQHPNFICYWQRMLKEYE